MSQSRNKVGRTVLHLKKDMLEYVKSHWKRSKIYRFSHSTTLNFLGWLGHGDRHFWRLSATFQKNSSDVPELGWYFLNIFLNYNPLFSLVVYLARFITNNKGHFLTYILTRVFLTTKNLYNSAHWSFNLSMCTEEDETTINNKDRK